jgi:hypothetical protein
MTPKHGKLEQKKLDRQQKCRRKENVHNSDEDQEPDEEEALSDWHFHCMATNLNIGTATGCVLNRWKTTVSAMPEKIVGKPLIHKLRVTHTFEADFNLWTGAMWGRGFVSQGKKINAFRGENWCQRNGRRHTNPLLLKQFSCIIMHLMKTNSGTFDNGAKAHCDRAVALLTPLQAQQLGMDHGPCRLWLNFLEQAKHHVETQAGVSDESCGSTPANRVHGPGQGNRGAGAGWMGNCTQLMQQQTAGSTHRRNAVAIIVPFAIRERPRLT